MPVFVFFDLSAEHQPSIELGCVVRFCLLAVVSDLENSNNNNPLLMCRERRRVVWLVSHIDERVDQAQDQTMQ